MNIASRKKTKTVLNITLELSITYTYSSFRFFIHHFKSVPMHKCSWKVQRIPSQQWQWYPNIGWWWCNDESLYCYYAAAEGSWYLYL